MGNPAYGPAQQAAYRNTNMLQAYSAAGQKALAPALDYAGKALNAPQAAYVTAAERGASTSGLEAAQLQGQGQRSAMLSRGLGPLAAGGGAFGGAAAAGAREQAGVATSSALAEVSQRNQMLSALTGGAATTTNLATGYGALTNAALRGFSQGANPAYEGTVGGLSALTPLLIQGLGAGKASPLTQAGVPAAYQGSLTNTVGILGL